MLYVLPPPAAAAGPPSPWSTILCDDGSADQRQQESTGTGAVANNGERLTYKRNASNNRRVKAWLNAVQKNNRPPPPRKPPRTLDVTLTTGPEVCVFARSFPIRLIHIMTCVQSPAIGFPATIGFLKLYTSIFFPSFIPVQNISSITIFCTVRVLPYQCICVQCTLFVKINVVVYPICSVRTLSCCLTFSLIGYQKMLCSAK